MAAWAVLLAVYRRPFVDEVADRDLAAEGRAFLLLECGHGGDGRHDIGTGCGRGGGHEPGDRLAVAGDGNGLAVLNPLQELGQVGLGFVGTDGVNNAPKFDWSRPV